MHNMINGNEGIGLKTTSLEGELFRSFQTKEMGRGKKRMFFGQGARAWGE